MTQENGEDGHGADGDQFRLPEATATAERVRTHIATSYQFALPNEEVGYLTLHIQRLLISETSRVSGSASRCWLQNNVCGCGDHGSWPIVDTPHSHTA